MTEPAYRLGCPLPGSLCGAAAGPFKATSSWDGELAADTQLRREFAREISIRVTIQPVLGYDTTPNVAGREGVIIGVEPR